MSKNIFSYLAWLVVAIVVAIVLFWLFGLRVSPREVQNVQVNNDDLPSGSVASSGERTIENGAAHYRLTAPVNWYVEKNGGTGLALYPDYAPKAASTPSMNSGLPQKIRVATGSPQAGAQPECKIEISALPNKSNLMLGDWLVGYLHQDPTVEIIETSQSAVRVSGRDAISWTGALNGISTTLAYVAGDGMVYEFAPSMIATSDTGQAARKNTCQDSLETVLKKFTVISQ
jgi:hypothetical protein